MEKSEQNEQGIIKCPKCGHEFAYSPGWLKVSIVVGCPKCSAMIRCEKKTANEHDTRPAS
jgi:predicted RNA-binding Zn-ribbon protein involved in translation (DUF1610 family)